MEAYVSAQEGRGGPAFGLASPELTYALVNTVEGRVSSSLPPEDVDTLRPLVPGWEAYSDDYRRAVVADAMLNAPNCNPCGPRGNVFACADYWIVVAAEIASGGGEYDTPLDNYDWCGE